MSLKCAVSPDIHSACSALGSPFLSVGAVVIISVTLLPPAVSRLPEMGEPATGSAGCAVVRYLIDGHAGTMRGFGYHF